MESPSKKQSFKTASDIPVAMSSDDEVQPIF